MAKLEWEKANRQDKVGGRRRPKGKAKSRRSRKVALNKFVAKHHPMCFKCGTAAGQWAKTGVSKKGPWVICVPCIQKRG
jgi:hypothetical protein